MASKPGGGGPGRDGGGGGGPGPGPPGGGRRRFTYEEKLASDLQYARLRLAKLQERYTKRQELVGQLQREVENRATQFSKYTAAEAAKSAEARQPAQAP